VFQAREQTFLRCTWLMSKERMGIHNKGLLIGEKMEPSVAVLLLCVA
jgi:hypothetical protein